MKNEVQRAEALSELEKAIGFAFQNKDTLLMALTHTSYAKSDGRREGGGHNERLEFLGDAVLELVVSQHLYQAHPNVQEGQLTRMRARLVCEQALFQAAKELGIPAFLLLGHGEELTGGRDKPSIVSDALEAVIGAVYLDGGMEAARCFIVSRVISLLESAAVDATDRDYKTRLQEYVQRDHKGKLTYELAGESGPEHKKEFTMRVLLNGTAIGEGTGVSKQAAGQAAAQSALAHLTKDSV